MSLAWMTGEPARPPAPTDTRCEPVPHPAESRWATTPNTLYVDPTDRPETPEHPAAEP